MVLAEVVAVTATNRVCHTCAFFNDVTGLTARNVGSCFNYRTFVLETDYCDAYLSKQAQGSGPEPDVLQWKKYANSTDESRCTDDNR